MCPGFSLDYGLSVINPKVLTEGDVWLFLLCSLSSTSPPPPPLKQGEYILTYTVLSTCLFKYPGMYVLKKTCWSHPSRRRSLRYYCTA